MTTLTISKLDEPGTWTRIWHALRTFDEALHDDPTDALHRRIASLEARLKAREPDTRSHAG